jgi:hypothetical protein
MGAAGAMQKHKGGAGSAPQDLYFAAGYCHPFGGMFHHFRHRLPFRPPFFAIFRESPRWQAD